jgi:Rrf2 family iron-sulfur cluster assembly transcriptional regulator
MHTISQTAEYALRAMAGIACRSTTEPILARDLSADTLIPEQYLLKILRRLVIAGLLESRKGRGGGFVLSRPPDRIRFRDVLEAVDAYPRENECAFGWGACDASRPCPLHTSWGPMSQALRTWATTSAFAGLESMPPLRAPRRAAMAFARRHEKPGTGSAGAMPRSTKKQR